MTGYGLKCLDMDGNVFKWLKIALNGWKWLIMAKKGWNYLETKVLSAALDAKSSYPAI